MEIFAAKNKSLTFLFLILILFTFLLTGCTENIKEALGGTIPETEEERLAREEEEKRIEEERILAERSEREEMLKIELGAFFVPLPPLEQEDNPLVKARGLYLTGNTAGRNEKLSQIIKIIEDTALNAVVIDVKNDHGVMSYQSNIQIVQEVKANQALPIKDIQSLLLDLKERNIYTIARIVAFKDPNLPEQKPEWAIQSNKGGIWRDRKGVAWVNPYHRDVWDYNIAIAKEAALMGFREIQFDYVRFPENAARVDLEAFYPENNGLNKDEAIEQFLEYAREQLKEYKVHLAADTFGVIATSWGDSDRIGQTWERVARNVEFNCPMIYPSHYGRGYFGFAVPDARPYDTVFRALTDAVKRNASLENPATIRPWLQSFTATWVAGYIPYRASEVRAQIEAALSLGIDEYLIWNPGNNYIKEAFGTEEDYEKQRMFIKQNRDENGLDILERSQKDALNIFLNSLLKKNWREALSLHSTDFSLSFDEYKSWMDNWVGRFKSFNILNNENTEEGLWTVKLIIENNGEIFTLESAEFKVLKENNIWRVKAPKDFINLLVEESLNDEDPDNNEEDIDQSKE